MLVQDRKKPSSPLTETKESSFAVPLRFIRTRMPSREACTPQRFHGRTRSRLLGSPEPLCGDFRFSAAMPCTFRHVSEALQRNYCPLLSVHGDHNIALSVCQSGKCTSVVLLSAQRETGRPWDPASRLPARFLICSSVDLLTHRSAQTRFSCPCSPDRALWRGNPRSPPAPCLKSSDCMLPDRHPVPPDSFPGPRGQTS